MECLCVEAARSVALTTCSKKIVEELLNQILYQTLVEPHVKSTSAITNCCILEKLQNRSIIVIVDSPYEAHANPLRNQLRLPAVTAMIHQETARMVHRTQSSQTLQHIFNLFDSIFEARIRTFRTSSLNKLPHV